MRRFDYRFLGDKLFDCVPGSLLRKTHRQKVVATDLTRLLVLQDSTDHLSWVDTGTVYRALEHLIKRHEPMAIIQKQYGSGRLGRNPVLPIRVVPRRLTKSLSYFTSRS